MTTVILVPRRAGFEDRDALWAWCRKWWEREFPELQIYEGHHNIGLFNRSAAINTASRHAGNWNMALIIDSDVFGQPARIREALKTAEKTEQIVVPFELRHNLTNHGSLRILDGNTSDWHPKYCGQHYHDQHSAIIAVPRKLWDQIGGFDEEFRGWGYEDTAFACSSETLGKKIIHLPGDLWHLHHHTAPEGKHGSPSTEVNRARMLRYKEAAARGDWVSIQLIRADKEANDETTIPRILHRTVPRETSGQVERWWKEFGALHPGWMMLTHRDPLDPADWPLSAPYWSQCVAGAQLADLIRLEALIRWGGVYVDSDMQPFRPLDPLLPLEVFAAWEDRNTIPNAVIGARRGHPLISQCLDLAIHRLKRKQGIWSSGPAVTTELFRDDPRVLKLPPESFYPVHYKDPDRDSEMRNFDPEAHPATFALHWYAFSWKENDAATARSRAHGSSRIGGIAVDGATRPR